MIVSFSDSARVEQMFTDNRGELRRRLDAIKRLADAGVPVGVMTAPMIPGLNDHEMEAILEAATKAGATRAGFTVLRLPLEIKELFEAWLRANRPDRAERVLSLVRQMRGGALYQAEFGLRMRGEGPIAQLLSARFATLWAAMAVPKQKQSHARTSKRRAQHKISAPSVNACPQCHQPRRPHRVCPNCGFYAGREVVHVHDHDHDH